MSTRPKLTVRRRLPATVADAYAEWLDPAALKEWMGPRPARVVRAALDPVVGGVYVIDMEDGSRHMTVSGRYLALDPGRVLRFTWSCDAWADPSVQTVVTVTFSPRAEECDMTITHEQLPDDQVPTLTSAWTVIALELEHHLARRNAVLRGAPAASKSDGSAGD
jgi:uncharacterized protein YndB with AHSA1/START domain